MVLEYAKTRTSVRSSESAYLEIRRSETNKEERPQQTTLGLFFQRNDGKHLLGASRGVSSAGRELSARWVVIEGVFEI
jgi:hypothetical protein